MKRALVVCPGRGTYGKAELGSLARLHGGKQGLLESFDAYRRAQGQTPVTELDGAARFSVARHTRGDNASPLIYACAYGDFLDIDREAFEIVAVTGNSMGWYIALACAGAASPLGALEIVNTMGTLMQERLIGGQLLYPLVDADWRPVPGRREELLALIEARNAEAPASLFVSIELGGYLVLAGSEEALAWLAERLPTVDGRFPLKLDNHAAFHSPLQAPVAAEGRRRLGQDLFQGPSLPLVDGRGALWAPYSSDPAALRDYTLGHQVVAPYDFTGAIRVAVRDFAPEAVIVLGPGTTLGGAVAQALVGMNWQGLASKADFAARQAEKPLLFSMGIAEQRRQVAARGR